MKVASPSPQLTLSRQSLVSHPLQRYGQNPPDPRLLSEDSVVPSHGAADSVTRQQQGSVPDGNRLVAAGDASGRHREGSPFMRMARQPAVRPSSSRTTLRPKERRHRRQGSSVPFLVSGIIGGLIGAAALPVAVSNAAHGPVVASAPGDVANLGGCTGFAVSASVILTAQHCGTAPGTTLSTSNGKHPTILDRVDVPGTDAAALVTDATDLVPFATGDANPSAGVTVYGYGRSADDPDGGKVMRRAQLGPGAPNNDELIWSVEQSGDTVCLGDSGAPAVQDSAVVGIVTGGDGPECGSREARGVAVQPATTWLRDNGTL